MYWYYRSGTGEML